MTRDKYGSLCSEFYNSQSVEQEIKYSGQRYDLHYMEYERARIIPGIRKTQKTIAGIREQIAKLQAEADDKEKAITLALQLDEAWYNRARQLEDPNMYYPYVVVEYWTKTTERKSENGRKLTPTKTPMVTVRVYKFPKEYTFRPYTAEEQEENHKKGYATQTYCYESVKEGVAEKISFLNMHTSTADGMVYLTKEGADLFAGISYFCNSFGDGHYSNGVVLTDPAPAQVAATVAEKLKECPDAEYVGLNQRSE